MAKHLEGEYVTYKDNFGDHTLLVVALMEYDMGITLKKVDADKGCKISAVCFNGPSSPNVQHYTSFKEGYPQVFQYIKGCIERAETIDTKVLNILLEFNGSGIGNAACATGMPV